MQRPVEQLDKPYVALFLDRESRLKLLRWWEGTIKVPLLGKVYADHVTLIYDPTSAELASLQLGVIKVVVVIGWSANERCQAVVVQGIESKNDCPHVTIATNPETETVYSNQLLAKSRTRVAGPMLRGTVDIRRD